MASNQLKKPFDNGGYQPRFLGNKFKIKFPELNSTQRKDLVKFAGTKFRLDYIHYSAVMSKKRRLAYFTAANIDGNLWKNNKRKGDFQNDTRLNGDIDQLGKKLYNATKSNFDKGHLVRREDPEWGDLPLSRKAGQNTFWFPNCTPQHKKLNRKIWAELEANILHTGADKLNLKINVFTGPVLAETDSFFVTKVQGKDIQLPNLFWKIVVWTKANGKAYAVGFLMSQEKFLIKGGIIKKTIVINAKKLKTFKDEDIFEHLEFKDGKTYQVRIKQIEKLTGLKFNWPGVIKPFKKPTPTAITGTPINKTKVNAKMAQPLAIKMNLKLKGLTL